MELYEMSLSDLAETVRTRRASPVEVIESSLTRLEQVEPAITAFATITAELALEQAATAEQEIANGRYRGPLHGIPLAVKDIFDTAGVRTTCSSRQRADNVPEVDSAAVAQLRTAGMIVVGKTETHEFAYASITPQTGNPWNPKHIPGGSSGGSGAAVGAGVVHVALGSDTGGSIRIPAALCGTVGLKPTFGRVSRAGVAPLAWSLDHVGPITRNVTDAAIALSAMCAYDRCDPASVDRPLQDLLHNIDGSIAGTVIGIPTNYYTDRITDEAYDLFHQAASHLEAMGAHLVHVEVPGAEHMVSTQWAIVLPESAAYHHEAMRNSPELFGDDVREMLEVGEVVLATDYINAMRLRTRIQQDWCRMFDQIDVLLAPSTPGPALPRDDPFFRWKDGTMEGATSAYSRMCIPANITGLPALQVPTALTSAGFPMGVQIIGRPFAEDEILRVGRSLEQATGAAGKIATPSL
ncbi:amidase [Rhodococcus sp. NPDC057529]|uniref:amidase n=1 Tax=Rhodococcus sp. NPDC057529 TaxID=3346158 RepID=UPI00366D8BFB